MIDATTDAPIRRRGLGAKLWALASRRGLIGGAGVFSVIAGALFGSTWIRAHRMYWEGQVDCSASMSSGPWFRHSVSVMALLAGATIAVTLVRIASSDPASRGSVAAHWIATATLWVTLVPIATTSVTISLCLQGIGP